MSHFVATATTSAHAIPLGRRIAEIMSEKGNYYSVSAMAARLGWSRETYRLMLKGERVIYTYELEKIANDLKVSMDRILQRDIEADANELQQLLSNRTGLFRALQLAQELLPKAIGRTERCKILLQLGWAYFERKMFEESLLATQEAHTLALEINQKYQENELKYRTLRNLMISYIEIKDHKKVIDVSNQVENEFDGQHIVLAELYYSRARVAEALGNLEEAVRFSQKSYENCVLSEQRIMVGRALINLSHFAYKMGNYLASQTYLEQSFAYLDTDYQAKLIATKELIKARIKLGNHSLAEREILVTLQDENLIPYSDLEGKLQILFSEAQQVIEHAGKVANEKKYSDKVRYLACSYLIRFGHETGDSQLFMKYYQLSNTICERHF
jgi:tetratricopeptide (TPR) repeat protein